MFDTIKNDLLETMKAKDKFKLDVIRMLKSAIQNEAIALKKDLSDDEVIAVIKREVKKRKSSIEEYTKYGKTDTVDALNKEIEILSVYLPPELSDEELNKLVNEVISKLGASTIKEMGSVIKEISSTAGNSVDMGKVSKLVKEKLS